MSRVQWNPAAIADLAHTAEMIRALSTIAEGIASTAGELAGAHRKTGSYQSSIGFEVARNGVDSVRVIARDWKSSILEARYGTLRRACDAAGVRTEARSAGRLAAVVMPR